MEKENGKLREKKGIREKRLKGKGGRDEGTGRWAKEETGRRA